jgi:hypothetical protein
MLLAYLTLFSGLGISAVAEFYSIMGLIAIYPAAVWPIIIMGVVLGIGKLTGTVWLKQNWNNAPVFLKTYLIPGVVVLMMITSIGVFGFLSKAHSDQSLVSGDVQSKIAVYDEKIKTEKENIDANRKALKQMDEAVDQVMARSTSEGGADKAVAIRRSQQKERGRLLTDITASQQKIATINEQRAPIAAEVRKVEAEVGPIKYIAAFIYGDNPDANVLEKAVTWVSILIVLVLDPMALILLLASQYSFEFERKKKDSPGLEMAAGNPEIVTTEDHGINNWFAYAKERARFWDQQKEFTEPRGEEPIFDREEIPLEEEIVIKPATPDPLAHIVIPKIDPDDLLHLLAKKLFMAANPEVDERMYHAQYQSGEIDQLPWQTTDYINTLPISDRERIQLIRQFSPTLLAPSVAESDLMGLEADNMRNKNVGEVRGFGTQFPNDSARGDMFLRVDQLPSALYKFNGNQWIGVDKAQSDQYAYDNAYIDHLISKIDSGEYDPELLSAAERDSIERRLRRA